MQRLTTSPAFNPFHVYVNGKRYEVGAFNFYKADGTMIKTRSGWFGYNNDIREGLEIPDVLLRRKEKLDGETFAIVSDRYGKKCVILYIPFDFFDFEQTEKVEDRGFYNLHCHVYTSRKNPKVFVADIERQWETENKEVKNKALLLLKGMVEAKREFDRLESEYKKLDPYNKLRYEYEKAGLLKE